MKKIIISVIGISILFVAINCNSAKIITKIPQSECVSCINTIKQIDNTNTKEEKLLELENRINSSLLSQQARLNDIWGAVSLLGYLAAFLGALITIVVVFFSFKSTKAAVTEAKIEANNIVGNWLNVSAEAVLISESNKVLQPKLQEALKEIKDAVTPILVKLDEELQKTTKINQELNLRNIKQEAEPEDISSAEILVDNITVETIEAENENTDFKESSTSTETSDKALTPRKLYFKARNLKIKDRAAEALNILEMLSNELENSFDERDIQLYLEVNIELANILDIKLEKVDQAIAVYESILPKLLNTNYPRVAVVALRALNHLSSLYVSEGELDNALMTSRQAIELYERVPSQSANAYPRYCRAISSLIGGLFESNRFEEAINTYNEHLLHLKSDKNTNLFTLHSSIVHTAKSYLLMNRNNEAKELLQSEINEKFDRKSQYARERILLSDILQSEDNLEEALLLVNQVISESNKQPNKPIGTYIYQALIQKAAILSKKRYILEELKTYDEIVEIWNTSGINKENYSVYAATALVNKALTLANSGDPLEALKVAKHVVEIFKVSLEHNVVEQITKAAKLISLLER